MLILGQNKMDLYVMGTDSYIGPGPEGVNVIARRIGKEMVMLGFYENQERIAEIINEITMAYAAGAKVFKMPKE